MEATTDEFFAARRAYYEASDRVTSMVEAATKVEYARLRAEDKAAGRDTSGKSVAMRRMLAHSDANDRPEIRAARAEVDEMWRHYRRIAGLS